MDPHLTTTKRREYKVYHNDKKMPINKLGHYMCIMDNHKEVFVPYHQFFNLQEPKNKNGNIIKYTDNDSYHINWFTVTWVNLEPYFAPSMNDQVWPEKGGNWRMGLKGWYIEFPSGLAFYPTEVQSLRTNNMAKNILPFNKKECKGGQWIINKHHIWEIKLANGETHIPL